MSAEGLSRRGFLQVSSAGGAGLLIGFNLFGCRDSKSSSSSEGPHETIKVVPPSELNAWVRIGADERITMLVSESEMGQGILTALPMVLAEELDADWSKVSSEHALADSAKYGRQSTGGSTSVRNGIANLRKVGATARAMLIAAAADTWKVPPTECRTESGKVIHTSGKKLSYGQLAEQAATITPPADPPLKKESEYRIVGKPLARLDLAEKVEGRAVFGIDVRIPDLLTAQIEHPPVWGATVTKFDGSKASKVPGVRHVVKLPTGVAVIGDHYWAAKTGRDALEVTWNEGKNATLSSSGITETLRAAVNKGVVARNVGNAIGVLRKAPAKRRLSAVYEVPYLAHTPMEPMNCTADVKEDSCQIWAPTQSPGRSKKLAAKITGLPEDKITLHTTLLGGGFGRRSQVDFVADAVHASKAIGKPVKVLWSREDGVRAGWYRPAAYNVMRGAVDRDGWPVAWEHKLSTPSILESLVPVLRDGIDGTSVEGAKNLPYAIPNIRVTSAKPKIPIPIWFWRSVGSSQNAYCTECFLDELAALGGKDPLEVRLRLLVDKPRHKRVLELAADRAGWGKPLAEGRSRGLAVHESFGSFVAQVVEVSLNNKQVRVHRVVCAVDCGQVINPDTIEAQMESGIAYGLSSALYGAIDIEKGRAKQSNFHDYRVVRMPEMPRVETHIVKSSEKHGGVGEPATPPITPAVVNALFAITKQPVRTLPIPRGFASKTPAATK